MSWAGERMLQFLPLALTGVQMLILAALFWLKTTFVARNRFDAACRHAEERAADAETRLKVLELRFADLPTVEDEHRLMLMLKTVEGQQAALMEQVRGMNAGMKRVEAQVGMLMQHHLRDSRA